jgi:hypothetical protein
MTYAYVTADVRVDLDQFDDQDIKDEYTQRFATLPSDIDWEQLFYIRRDKPLTEFLTAIDSIILDMSGRVM